MQLCSILHTLTCVHLHPYHKSSIIPSTSSSRRHSVQCVYKTTEASMRIPPSALTSIYPLFKTCIEIFNLIKQTALRPRRSGAHIIRHRTKEKLQSCGWIASILRFGMALASVDGQFEVVEGVIDVVVLLFESS